MRAAERFVLDTNTIISGALFAGSVPDQAVRLALRLGTLLFSLSTLRELIDVLKREKFDRYLNFQDRTRYVEAIQFAVEVVEPVPAVTASRDPKDNTFLALATAGNASAIVTGDLDLRVLGSYDGIPILTPTEFVARFGGSETAAS